MALCQNLLQVPSSAHASTKKVPAHWEKQRGENRHDVGERYNKQPKNTMSRYAEIRKEVDKLAEDAPRSENIT